MFQESTDHTENHRDRLENESLLRIFNEITGGSMLGPVFIAKGAVTSVTTDNWSKK